MASTGWNNAAQQLGGRWRQHSGALRTRAPAPVRAGDDVRLSEKAANHTTSSPGPRVPYRRPNASVMN